MDGLGVCVTSGEGEAVGTAAFVAALGCLQRSTSCTQSSVGLGVTVGPSVAVSFGSGVNPGGTGVGDGAAPHSANSRLRNRRPIPSASRFMSTRDRRFWSAFAAADCRAGEDGQALMVSLRASSRSRVNGLALSWREGPARMPFPGSL